MTELIAAASSLPLLQKQRAWSTQMLVKFQPIDTICPSDGMVDITDLKSVGRKIVPVQVRPWAPSYPSVAHMVRAPA